MANVIIPKEGDPTAGAPSKDGTDYDNCPNAACGTRDVDKRWKFGGKDSKGEEYRFWSMYHCDDCGVNWSRTTRQGEEYYARRGQNRSKWKTAAADKQRFTSAPSERYRANYELIDWTK